MIKYKGGKVGKTKMKDWKAAVRPTKKKPTQMSGFLFFN